MKLVNALAAIAALVGGMALATAAHAQADASYPSRPVRILIPAAPGGVPDFIGRSLAEKMTASFGGRAFVVENAAGAGGLLPAVALSKAPGNPHLLMLGDSSAMAIAVTLTPASAFDPLRDFTPITALASVALVLGVHPDLKASSLAEFVAAAKAKPRELNYGSIGPGSFHHLTMEMLAARAGIAMTHVAYRSGAALVQALLAGEIQAAWASSPNLEPSVRSGRLKALAISGRERFNSLPDVPTVAQAGYPGFAMATTMGLVAPSGIPGGVVSRLQAVAARTLREPDIAARLAQMGVTVEENGTEHYVRFLREDIERFRTAVNAAGMAPK